MIMCRCGSSSRSPSPFLPVTWIFIIKRSRRIRTNRKTFFPKIRKPKAFHSKVFFRLRKIDKNDSLKQLLAIDADLVGAVSINAMPHSADQSYRNRLYPGGFDRDQFRAGKSVAIPSCGLHEIIQTLSQCIRMSC